MVIAVDQEHKMMVRIPQELHRAFVQCVREQDLKVSQVVRGLVKAYLEAHGVTVRMGRSQDDVNNLIEGAQ